jgi:hypothetical protein
MTSWITPSQEEDNLVGIDAYVPVPSLSNAKPNVGSIAINDSFMLEAAVYFFLKKHFGKEPYYVYLLELFHDVSSSLTSIF